MAPSLSAAASVQLLLLMRAPFDALGGKRDKEPEFVRRGLANYFGNWKHF